MKKLLALTITHLTALILGFSLGIYALPILTAPPAPSMAQLASNASKALFVGEFKRDLAGSDFLHWGQGKVTLSERAISLDGTLAPGPDYKLYLSTVFVQTEAEFEQARASMRRVGDVKTFENFHVAVPKDIELSAFNSVIVWCESFGEFITAAKYR